MAREAELHVDGIAYDLDKLGIAIPEGLFQLLPDGSRQTFPSGAMRTKPEDLDAAHPEEA